MCASAALLGFAGAVGPTPAPSATPQLPLRWNVTVGPSNNARAFRIRHIGEHTVLVGQRSANDGANLDPTVKAYRTSDGQELWTQPLSSDAGVFSQSAVVAGSDHFGAFVAPGNVATVVNETGSIAWALQLPSSAPALGIAVSAAAAAADATIAVATTEALTVARGGDVVRRIAGRWGESVVISGAANVVVASAGLGSSDSYVVALNLTNGELLWNVTTTGFTAVGDGPTSANDNFVATINGNTAQLYALSNGELVTNVTLGDQLVLDVAAGPSSLLYVTALSKTTGWWSLSAWASSTSKMWNFSGFLMTAIGVSLERLLVGVCAGGSFVMLDGVAGTQFGTAACDSMIPYNVFNRPLFLGQSAYFTGASGPQTTSLRAVDVMANSTGR